MADKINKNQSHITTFVEDENLTLEQAVELFGEELPEWENEE